MWANSTEFLDLGPSGLDEDKTGLFSQQDGAKPPGHG